MTLLTVQNALISHFLHSQSFIASRDLDGLDMKEIAKKAGMSEELAENQEEAVKIRAQIAEYSLVKKDLVMLALKNLEETGLVKKVNDNFWILVAPITQMAQEVTISPMIAEMVAETINNYRESYEVEEGECSKIDLAEEDILNLCNIVQMLLSEISEKEDFNGDDDDDKRSKK